MFHGFLKWLGIKTPQEAHNIKQRISILYAIVGWNCFAVCFYKMIKNRLPESREDQRTVYKELGISNNTYVYQGQGLTLINEFELTSDDNMTAQEDGEVKIDENLGNIE